MKVGPLGNRALVVACLVLMLAAIATAAPSATPTKSGYYAKIDYVIASKIGILLEFEDNAVRDVTAPPAPPGYELLYMKIYFPRGLPGDVAPIKFDRKVEKEGEVLSLVAYDGTIKLAFSGTGNATLGASLECVYAKTVWVEIPESGVVEFTVEEPVEPFDLSNLTVRISVDNYAPYRIKDLVDPLGQSLLDPAFQESVSPAAVKIDPKNAELNFAYGLEVGEYEAIFEYGEDYSLPNAFIAREDRFFNDTIAPMSSKTFASSSASGWDILGYVVVLYSLHPLSGSRGGAEVKSTMVDYAYYEDRTIRIEGASYLIPPLDFELWIKAYIVYGTWFKVVNMMSEPVNVVYAPVLIKETGEWTKRGLKARITESDVKDAVYAYLVVQIPHYGKIKNVITPGGGSLGEYAESLLPWSSGVRAVSVLEDQAYVQVKCGSASELGVYTFEIEWTPIELKVVDADGEPIAGALVKLEGPIEAVEETDEEGIAKVVLYEPGPYKVEVEFKSTKVAELELPTITDTTIEIECAVYNVIVEVTDVWGRPLEGAEVVFEGAGGNIVASGETDNSGALAIEQIPGGDYKIEVTYKRVKGEFAKKIGASRKIRLGLDVLFEIPFINLPISKLEALAAALSTSALGIGGYLVSNRKKKEYGEEAVELEL